VGARSEVLTVFARSNSGIMRSNFTQGIDVCVLLVCVCVVRTRGINCLELNLKTLCRVPSSDVTSQIFTSRITKSSDCFPSAIFRRKTEVSVTFCEDSATVKRSNVVKYFKVLRVLSTSTTLAAHKLLCNFLQF
jgi:hypothetical protein